MDQSGGLADADPRPLISRGGREVIAFAVDRLHPLLCDGLSQFLQQTDRVLTRVVRRVTCRSRATKSALNSAFLPDPGHKLLC